MENQQDVPPYPMSPPPMPAPIRLWWKQPRAMMGCAVAVAVASFLVGFAFGRSTASTDSADNMTAAEKGKSDAQWIFRNHTRGGDVSINSGSPDFACGVAENGVGFIRFYTAEQSQEYLAACEEELAALTSE
ncbi:hypothetical protein [Streptomyces sp. NPDC007905]|uniref:hypothetical protein n=1 Tax=Streptomyces sp. NPDC007905 TaxID=3364788 RepID=UPI0036E8133E